MRLLNTTTLEFAEYYDEDAPDYAILSHRWLAGEEVSYQDYCICLDQARYGGKLPAYLHEKANDIRARSGFAKIKDFCKAAKAEEYSWAWIDTCCIDKSSSSELSEAINSMWVWYNESGLCFVYLSDVAENSSMPEMAKSTWFTRSWTLQELLAPSHIRFTNRDWTLLFYLSKGEFVVKDDEGYTVEEDPAWGDFGNMLAGASHVPAPYIAGLQNLASASVAVKLSWASYRRASRVEDRAYSLLGLLDISMPLLYGERNQAFIRLQREFIQTYDDESIFAWTLSCVPSRLSKHEHCHSGLLASKLEYFRDSHDIIEVMQYGKQPWQITKQLLLVQTNVHVQNAEWAAVVKVRLPLACKYREQRDLIHLELWASNPSGSVGGHFSRALACGLMTTNGCPTVSEDRRLVLRLT